MTKTLHDVRDELAEWATSDIPRVPLGYTFFDHYAGGIATGELCVLIARSGVGKTYFLLNVILNNPKTPTVLFSMEMHARYMVLRLASMLTGEPTRTIEQEMARTGRHYAVDEVVERYPHLRIDDEAGRSISEMSEVLADYESDVGTRPVLVGVDYLELIRAYGMTQTESVDDVARSLKNFARAEDVAVFALHQVSRGERHKPKGHDVGHANEGHRMLGMTDARFGGDTQADYLLGMYKPSKNPALGRVERQATLREIRLQFLKNRAGMEIPSVGVQADWNPNTGKITDMGLGPAPQPQGDSHGLRAVAG